MSDDRTWVLVTGALGFIGAYVVRDLLERGHRVVAAVRSLDDPRLASLGEHPEARLRFVLVDLFDPQSLSAAMSGVSAVIHVASPYHLHVEDPERDLVSPAVLGTENVIRAALAADRVDRVVVTSSIAALSDAPPNDRALNEDDWNQTSSLTRNPYYYSKTLAEKKAFELVGNHPKIRLATILPGVVLGPCLSSHVSESHDILLDPIRGKIPGYISLAWGLVDVRDVARAHVLAMENQAARGRYVCVAETRTQRHVVGLMRTTQAPQGGLPRAPWDNALGNVFVHIASYFWPSGIDTFLRTHLGRKPVYDHSKIQRELGLEFRDVDACVVETVQSFVALGLV